MIIHFSKQIMAKVVTFGPIRSIPCKEPNAIILYVVGFLKFLIYIIKFYNIKFLKITLSRQQL